jgi:hypothetical protein
VVVHGSNEMLVAYFAILSVLEFYRLVGVVDLTGKNTVYKEYKN